MPRSIIGWPHDGAAPTLVGNLERCSVCRMNTWVSGSARVTAGDDAVIGCMKCASEEKFTVDRSTVPSYGPTPDKTRDLVRWLMQAVNPEPARAVAAETAPVVERSGLLASIRERFGITVGNKPDASIGEKDNPADSDEDDEA